MVTILGVVTDKPGANQGNRAITFENEKVRCFKRLFESDSINNT